MSRTNLKLHGQFKVDVFDCSGKLLRTSDYITNFITNSGTIYPYYFAFADCFRFLSLGTGTGYNSIGTGSYPETTGLSSGVSGFQYIGSGNYSTGGFLGGGCGNFANPNSNTISLIRQWGLPDISGNAFTSTHAFTEIMVSPGRPYFSGWVTNDNVTYFRSGACSCEDFVFTQSGNPNEYTVGPDGSQVAVYYGLLRNLNEAINNQSGSFGGTRPRLQLCDAPLAFSRITGNFTVHSGEVLAITYQLNLTFSTGIQKAEFYSSITPQPDYNWSALGFVGNITNPGIKLIVDGQLSINSPNILAPNGSIRTQHIDYFTSFNYPLSQLYGESFVPSMGIPLEPSCIYGNGGNFAAYISDDDIQFLVSSSGGICNTGIYQPWNPAGTKLPQNSGLLAFKTLISGNTIGSDTIDSGSSDYWYRNPYNIRIVNNLAGYPDTGDVTSFASSYTPKIYTGAQSRSFFTSGNRGGSILTSYAFPNYYFNNPIGSVLYVRSYVVGFIDSQLFYSTYPNSYSDTQNIVPFFDCIMSGRSGSGVFIPNIVTGTINNVIPTKITNSQNKGYNYFTGANNSLFPTFQNLLSWSADCPSGVKGC